MVTAGVMPSSTTLRTSTPSGVPALSCTGILNRLDRPAHRGEPAVSSAASRMVAEQLGHGRRPGRGRRAEPGQLEHRAVADVPGAGLRALAGVVQRVADLGRFGENHSSAPASLIPNVVPLRDIVVTIEAS